MKVNVGIILGEGHFATKLSARAITGPPYSKIVKTLSGGVTNAKDIILYFINPQNDYRALDLLILS